MDGYDINKLSISLPQTLYLAHTQAGKTELKAMGCGQGKESRVLTIHEAQGLASKMWSNFTVSTDSALFSIPILRLSFSSRAVALDYGIDLDFDIDAGFL
ncbi:hypothetical protein EVAR_100583_1 [Eumeta japonica]|uniref:(+)RNA virus helicase C-terminal domain-containing protein n=1 Tax=Eumeta variegata TaxID=151549 RepID=A0A4C1YB70_EUMVA|nr:hypothetical protein EVAR_100583_1 [Eumeta japonica]